MREAAADTLAYVDGANQDLKEGPKFDLQAFARAMDAALESRNVLRLAEIRFLMGRCRTGNPAEMQYAYVRLGLLKTSELAEKVESGTSKARPAGEDEGPALPSAPGLVQYGAYLPELKELVLWRSDQFVETLRHEAFHQFLDTYVDDCPAWFGEGFATYFEVSRGGVPVDHAIRQREIGLKLNAVPPIETLMKMSLREFQRHPEVSALYAESWSFIHFLIKAGHRWRLDRYFDLLSSGRGEAEARREAFGAALGALEDQWLPAAASGKY